jgi:beta-galactosidase
MKKQKKIGMNHFLYILDGVETPIYSGTLHFWRTPPRSWNKRLLDMKDAFCNTVDTYIAWNWHEPQEGKFDFHGKTEPRRNLEGFLELVEKNGLYAIVRPGPYICAEWRNGGIPDWLLQSHPEILSRDSSGKILPAEVFYPPITYLHPNYLAYVEKWYDKTCEVLRKHLYTNGGCIINVTIDDEPSYWETVTYPLMSDYNEFIIGSKSRAGVFQKWLKEECKGDISLLNRKYHTRYSDFVKVEPPRAMPKHYKEIPRFIDWHHFKLYMTNVYVENLYKMLIKRAIDVPMSLLDPYLLLQSWSSFQEFCRKRHLRIDLWTEFWPRSHYRSFDFKEDKIGEVAYKTGIYRSLTKEAGTPPVSIETQAYLAHHIEPDEAELLYLTIIAYGINNINYYLMVGGENPSGLGCHTGKTWDISCPIALDGKRRPHFDVIQRLGQFFKLHGVRLANTETVADIAVGYYEPYEASLFVENALEHGFEESLQGLYQEYLLGERGFLTLLSMSGVKFDMVDLQTASIEDLLRYGQLWVYAFDFMDEKTQKKLVEFVKHGGKLVALPGTPYLNENMENTNIMKKLYPAKLVSPVKAKKLERLVPFFAVNAEDIEEMVVKDYIRNFELTDETPIAWDSKTKKPCAYRRKFGKGNATLIGFKIQYFPSFHDFHRHFIRYVLNLDGVKGSTYTENMDMLVIERKGKGYSYLFVLNSIGLPVKSKVSFVDPSDGKRKSIPSFLDGIELKNRGGLILAINFPLTKVKAIVSHTTSMIQRVEEKANSFALTLYGQRDTRGETAIVLPHKPHAVEVEEGRKIKEKWIEAEKRLYVIYEHGIRPVKLKVAP